jgi:hypothetical protein
MHLGFEGTTSGSSGERPSSISTGMSHFGLSRLFGVYFRPPFNDLLNLFHISFTSTFFCVSELFFSF